MKLLKKISLAFKSMRVKKHIAKSITQLQQRLDVLDAKKETHLNRINKHRNHLISMIDECVADLRINENEQKSIQDELQLIIKNVARYEHELNSVRQELQIAEEIVIPELTAALKLSQQRWDTETAIAAKNQMSSLQVK